MEPTIFQQKIHLLQSNNLTEKQKKERKRIKKSTQRDL